MSAEEQTRAMNYQTSVEPAAERAAEESTETQSGVDGLLSQLRVIEDQPLTDRATAYAHIHDRLHSRLEGGDSQNRHA